MGLFKHGFALDANRISAWFSTFILRFWGIPNFCRRCIWVHLGWVGVRASVSSWMRYSAQLIFDCQLCLGQNYQRSSKSWVVSDPMIGLFWVIHAEFLTGKAPLRPRRIEAWEDSIRPAGAMGGWRRCVTLCWFGYGSIPIHSILSGMNIHLPAILMWTTGVPGFWHTAIWLVIGILKLWAMKITQGSAHQARRCPKGFTVNPMAGRHRWDMVSQHGRGWCFLKPIPRCGRQQSWLWTWGLLRRTRPHHHPAISSSIRITIITIWITTRQEITVWFFQFMSWGVPHKRLDGVIFPAWMNTDSLFDLSAPQWLLEPVLGRADEFAWCDFFRTSMDNCRKSDSDQSRLD